MRKWRFEAKSLSLRSIQPHHYRFIGAASLPKLGTCVETGHSALMMITIQLSFQYLHNRKRFKQKMIELKKFLSSDRLRGYPWLVMKNEILNELLTVVIKRGIYTLRHPLEYILNCCWHCRVQQQTLCRSGQSLHCCRVCTMLRHHTRHRGRRIQRFLRRYIVGAELHFLFLLHWWCRNDPRCWDYRVCKEGPSEVLRQRRRSRWCPRCYIHPWRQHSAFLQHLSCRSGRSLPGCTHAGAGLHDEDRRRLGRALRVTIVDEQMESEPSVECKFLST